MRVEIARTEAATGRPECPIVLTKTLHTANALEAARGVPQPDMLVLTLLDGLGNVERLARFVAPERIAVGVPTVPSDRVGPGHVHSHGEGRIRMMMADGRPAERLSALAPALTEAGLAASIDPAVQSAIWQKFACNAALNSSCAVASATVDEAGLHATPDHALDHHVAHKPSMLQDLMTGRPTEIDATNGQVLRAARRLGVPAPCTESLDALVRRREALAAER